MADATIDTVAIEFEGNVEKLSNSTSNLIKILNTLKSSTSDSIKTLSSLSSQVKGLTNTTDKYVQSANRSSNAHKSTALNALKHSFAYGAIAKSLAKMIKSSAEAISTQVRFNSVFGRTKEALNEASEWVEKYANAMYADKTAIQSAMSTFKQLTNNMGVNNETSDIMSKNLTQLAYDLAATGIAGTDVNEVFTALRSGIGGEAEALKRYGVMLNQATLQETLYANGINRKVQSLNAAEKAELIYYQIMQSTIAQQGYAAKSLLLPANALQIVKTQFGLLAKAIGNLFIPMLMAAIPYVIALTKMLTQLAEAIARFFNIKIDFSNSFEQANVAIGGMEDGLGAVGDSADAANKKIKNMLRDFDELHVINFDDDTQSGSGSGSGIGGAGGGGLDLPLLQYDALSSLLDENNEKLEKARQIIEKIKDYIVAIGLALAGFKIAKNVLDFLNGMNLLSQKANVLQAALGIGLSIGSIWLLYKGMSKLLKGDITAESIAETALGMIGLTAGAMLTAKGLGFTLSLGNAFRIIAGIGLAIAGINLLIQGAKRAINLGKIDGKSFLQTVMGGALVSTGGALMFKNPAILRIGLGLTLALEGIALEFQGIKKMLSGDISLGTILKATGNAFLIGLGVWMLTGSMTAGLLTTAGVLAFNLGVEIGVALRNIDWATIKENIDNLKQKIADVFVEFGVNIKNGLEETANWINTSIENIINRFIEFKDQIVGKVIEIKDNVVNYFTTMKDNVGNKVKELKNNVVNSFNEFKNNANNKVSEFKDNVSNNFNELKDNTINKVTETKDKIINYFTDLKNNAGNRIKEFKDNIDNKFTELKTNAVNKVIETKDNVVNKFTELKDNSINRIREFKDNIVNKFIELKTNAVNKITETKDNVVNRFTTMKDNAINKIVELKDNIINKFESIRTGIKDKIERAKDIVREQIQKIKDLFHFDLSLPDIKLPHFEWTSTPASGWMAEVLSALNLPTSLPKLKVDWYDQGGFPRKGDLFVANENAPEMIGKMGNRNVVANNQQITEGIAAGVFDAISSIDFGGNGDTYVYIGDREVTDVITRKQKRNNDKFGR